MRGMSCGTPLLSGEERYVNRSAIEEASFSCVSHHSGQVHQHHDANFEPIEHSHSLSFVAVMHSREEGNHYSDITWKWRVSVSHPKYIKDIPLMANGFTLGRDPATIATTQA